MYRTVSDMQRIIDVLSLLSSDEDSENEDVPIPRNPEQRWIRPRIDYFEVFTNRRFYKRFKLQKSSVLMLLDRIQPSLELITIRNAAVPPKIQLLLTLRFYATGSYLMTVGDFVDVSPISAFRIVHQVSLVIASLLPEFIRLPRNPEEMKQAKRELFNISGFIRVVGALDTTQVRIQCHGEEDAELYRNRKGYYSIKVQAVVNARLEFINIVARWPGSTHDVTVFNNSRLKHNFDNGQFENALILGDSAYPNLPYLMTPLARPVTPAEHLYNEAQMRTLNLAERTFGIWSRKFAVINRGSRFHKVERTLTIIVATAVLHNIARRAIPPPEINPNIYDAIPEVNHALPAADVDARRHLIDTYFQNLL